MTSANSTRDHDVAIAGGGLAGAGLATVMARAGARVLVVERATVFEDRVRGEWLAPWGVREARLTGLLDVVLEAGGQQVPWNVGRSGKPRFQSSPDGDLPLGFSHPALQEAMLAAAAGAGAEVLRGATVEHVSTGRRPAMRVRRGGSTLDVRARLVVGAEGRGSRARRAIGRPEHEHRSGRLLAGVLVGGLGGPDDTSYFLIREHAAGLAMLYPQGGGLGRAYAFLPDAGPEAFAGPQAFARFLAMLVDGGVPAGVLHDATPQGPLAAFVASDSWVESPYRDGVAVIGDAAGISDPTWGMGIALALRDVRVLSEALLGQNDWDLAGAQYAGERDRYFDAIRTVENWHAELLLTPGSAADARRRHAARAWSSDPSRLPDMIGLGPDLDVGEQVRRRFFGEDVEAASDASSRRAPPSPRPDSRAAAAARLPS
jgi:2-polyprenyl-6-methoxyphenol hydroxylase-like FAD-dependent oxidoreductase